MVSQPRDPTSRRAILFLGTLAVVLLDWLLFELVRTPYRPPQDMLTLLGQEKIAVVGFMSCLAIGWMAVSLWLFATTRFSLRDYLGFMTLVAVLLSAVLYIVRYPHRSTTPWEMLWM